MTSPSNSSPEPWQERNRRRSGPKPGPLGDLYSGQQPRHLPVPSVLLPSRIAHDPRIGRKDVKSTPSTPSPMRPWARRSLHVARAQQGRTWRRCVTDPALNTRASAQQRGAGIEHFGDPSANRLNPRRRRKCAMPGKNMLTTRTVEEFPVAISASRQARVPRIGEPRKAETGLDQDRPPPPPGAGSSPTGR